MHHPSRIALFAGAAAILTACSGGDGAGPSARSQVTFNLSSGGPTTGALLTDTLTAGTDTLLLDSVQLVLRDIRFKRVDDDACEGDDDQDEDVRVPVIAASMHDDDEDDDGEHEDGEHEDGEHEDDDGCESFNAGPFLLDLPLGPEVIRAFSVMVDTGTYDELRIKIHKPEDDNGDPKDIAFLAQHPEFKKISIRAFGSFNGTPFTFESDLNAQQRMDLVPPVTVADSVTDVGITIQVDVSTWFKGEGGALVDPATANKGGANANRVKDNIRDSFRAFHDDDRDGECDEDEHDGDDGDDGDHDDGEHDD